MQEEVDELYMCIMFGGLLLLDVPLLYIVIRNYIQDYSVTCSIVYMYT